MLLTLDCIAICRTCVLFEGWLGVAMETGPCWRFKMVHLFWIYGGIRFLSLWSSEMVLYPIALISCRIRGVYVFDIGLFRYLQDVCSFWKLLVLPSRLDLLWCSSCVGTRGRFARRSFFLLIWAKLQVGLLEMLHRSRGRSSQFALDEWGVIGGDWKISVFNYYLCFDVIWSILQFLCYVFLFACHWASVYVKADFLAWKRGRGQVFTTHCVQVFMPIVSRIFSYFCTLVASWKLGRIVSPWAVSARFWLKSE